MLKINLVCVGSIKEKFYTEAVKEYQKRLSRFCSLSIIEVQEEAFEKSIDKKIDKESEKILNACKGVIILLDREGKMLSSEDLAKSFDKLSTQGVSEISMVIGGSNGVNSELKSKARQIVSFGKITFPHQLFRVVLLEQVYRAFCINNKTPYHK